MTEKAITKTVIMIIIINNIFIIIIFIYAVLFAFYCYHYPVFLLLNAVIFTTGCVVNQEHL